MRIVPERVVTERWVVGISLSLGLIACSESNLQPTGQPGIDTRMHQLLNGPSLNITIEQAPQIIVTTSAPLNCSPNPVVNSAVANLSASNAAASHQAVTSCIIANDQPLPDKIVFRYRAAPSTPNTLGFAAEESLSKPQLTADSFINWQTYTLYPQRIMQKYKDSSLLETLQQSQVELTVTFDENLRVTTTDELRFQN